MSFHPRAAEQLFTLRDWLRFAVSRFEEAGIFFGHGTHNSYDEAVWLILSALHLPHDTLENFLDAVVTEDERRVLAHLIERRITERIPTAYLVREAWLGDFKFYVDERVIVPRSFIAELLREQLAPWVENPEEVVSVADICTGSGCLAILAAHAFPNANVDAIDISDDALAVARRNISDYGLDEHVHPIKSDMLSSLMGKHYDIIISNPPYVDAPSMETLPQEYRQEPGLALASGDDGLDHTHTLLHNAVNHLNPGGYLIVEIGHNRDALEAAYPDLPFTWLEVSGGDQFVFMLTREQLI
ncbi:MAG TPA: 50S ribosomal protein L3 N(5)-glutamine methyltransferase [Methylophilaceae bacterium]|nr:50S ribosomal protein L3 N(5)-glutamine methyltransferase [Methylophilaceae bacterium]HQR60852.1 50S ribosomal protein L3 N(5)-glutamine methyltransferase [Methylophilaceae bacterium]